MTGSFVFRLFRNFRCCQMLLLVAILRFYRWQFYFYLFIYFLRSFLKIVAAKVAADTESHN